jgi:phenylacetate-CoA ligase
MFNTKFYELMNPFLQKLIICGRSLFMNLIKYSNPYSKKMLEINETQWLSDLELKKIQERKVLDLVKYAIVNVPFYSEYCSKNNIGQQDFNTIEDLKKLPIIKKIDVANNTYKFLSKKGNKIRFKLKTSGTTGTPLDLFQDSRTIAIENAFVSRQYQWMGFKKGQKQAWIRGDMIIPFKNKTGPFWRMNCVENKLMMSSYHLSKDNIISYINKLSDFDPIIINAYPSSIAYIANYIIEKKINRKFFSLKGILTSSETLSLGQREAIKKAFKVPIYNWYGNLERTVTMSSCEHQQIHLNSEYCYVEFVKSGNGLHEIISTGFSNHLMPLIRYRTGDLVKLCENGFKCQCGRELPSINEVYGRIDDYIKTPDGRWIGRTSQILKGCEKIAESQFIQNAKDEVEILIVPISGFNFTNIEKIVSNAQLRLGENMKINVKIVDKINRTKSGKLKSVVCNI